MGLLDRLRDEIVDVIEWLDHTRDSLVWRFPRFRNEIKNGAHLIVRPGQAAIFVHRGEIADVFTPGSHILTTDNLPILSTLAGWKHGFESPFKSEVYFVNTRQITELTWGTPTPMTVRDPEFGVLRLRAYGTYALRAFDPKALLHELVGTDDVFEADEIHELMRALINSCAAEVFGNSGIPAVELAANTLTLADRLRLAVAEKIDDEYGLDVPALFIADISFPEEVQQAIDARSSMNLIGDLGRYQTYQLGKSMPIAAASSGGSGDVLGIGMGLAMAGSLTGTQPGQLTAPPPVPAAATFHVVVDGQSGGPYTVDQLARAAAQGRVNAETLVWTAGMPGWAPARQVPLLASILAPSVPPPLPEAGSEPDGGS